ncbi:hypothetical protein [Legionella sp. CNM-4043-24]|uniref:hypothetical protein n=1 Tax=Legionella sp. CNM-4043-24 TaxID=3421646 RepID=UPI00403AA908
MDKTRAMESFAMTLPAISDSSEPVEVDELLLWLRLEQERVEGKERFLLESLYASFLEDINKSLLDDEKAKDRARVRQWRALAKLVFLMLVGFIYFAAEGFDGIASLLGLTAMPAAPVFAIGLAVGLLWAGLFFAVQLMEISKDLGITIINAPRLVHIYTHQVDNMKAIRKKISQACDEMDEAQLKSKLAILQMLLSRMQTLDKARDVLVRASNNQLLTVGKYLFAAVAGGVIFCGGFMAGQTVALVFGALILGAVSPTVWPVILFSVAIGLAAFSLYWFAGRQGIENLIGRCLGLDKGKVDAFCNKELVDKENKKLNLLSDRLSNRLDGIEDRRMLLSENQHLLNENRRLRTLLERQLNTPDGQDVILVDTRSETACTRNSRLSRQITFFSDLDCDATDSVASRSDWDNAQLSDLGELDEAGEQDEMDSRLQSQCSFYEGDGNAPLRCQ